MPLRQATGIGGVVEAPTGPRPPSELVLTALLLLGLADARDLYRADPTRASTVHGHDLVDILRGGQGLRPHGSGHRDAFRLTALGGFDPLHEPGLAVHRAVATPPGPGPAGSFGAGARPREMRGMLGTPSLFLAIVVHLALLRHSAWITSSSGPVGPKG